MVYQQFINYPSLTVYENIASPLRVQGKPRAEIEKRVQEAAKLLKLEPYLNRTPLQLSGGQQQRTAIARALVKGADLVLLDEPLANLDYKLREELRTELPRIFEASGAIFVYATTEPSEALLLGGRTVCMWEGQVLQVGETSKVYRHPDTMRVAQVFSDPPLNIVGIEKHNGSVQYAGGVQAPASGLYAGLGDGAYRVGFRAHQLEVANGIAGRHAFSATVTVTEITGSESFVHLNRDDSNWVAVLQGVHEFPPGHVLDAVLDPEQCLCVRRGRPPGRRARRDVRACSMARIDLVDLAHSYGGNAADSGILCAQAGDDDLAAGRRLCAARAVGLRQDHAAQSDLGHRDAVARPDPVRRRRHHAAVNPEAQYRAGVPVSGDLRHHDGRTESGIPAEESRRAESRDRRAGRRDRAAARPARLISSRKAMRLTADAKQKISLGRGLVRSDVAAVLFDEPLTVIDPELKWQLRSKLKALHRELDLTMIYVTHDQTEALTFADTVVVMHDGRVVQSGTPAELFDKPAHTFVGYFIGSPGMNIVPAEVSGREARIGGHAIALDRSYDRPAGRRQDRDRRASRIRRRRGARAGVAVGQYRADRRSRPRPLRARFGSATSKFAARVPPGFSVAGDVAGLVFDPSHVHVYADSLLVEGAA